MIHLSNPWVSLILYIYTCLIKITSQIINTNKYIYIYIYIYLVTFRLQRHSYVYSQHVVKAYCRCGRYTHNYSYALYI